MAKSVATNIMANVPTNMAAKMPECFAGNMKGNVIETAKKTAKKAVKETVKETVTRGMPRIFNGKGSNQIIDTDNLKHIMLVEDEDVLRKSAAIILMKNGYSVSVASSGREGEEKIEGYHSRGLDVDLVIVDIRMPDLSGIGLIKNIRRANQHVPILAVTEYGSKQIAGSLMEIGCTDYVEIPFRQEELVNKIQSILYHAHH